MAEIRLARCADIPALQRFFHEHWRANHILSRDEALLRWQYGRGVPGMEGESLTMLLVIEDGGIHGMLGFIPVTMRLTDGREVAGVWLSHWLVVERLRASGAGLQLLARLRQLGYEAIGVLGINATVQELYRRLGFTIIDDLPRHLAITDMDGARSLAKAAGLSLAATTLGEWLAPELAMPACVGEWKGTFGGAIKRWLCQFSASNGGTVRDAGYMEWRYMAHPRFDYRYLVRQVDGEVDGVAVWRIEQVRDRGERVLRVIELMATEDAAGELATGLTATARREGACFADLYGTRLPERGLREAGFRRLAADSSLGHWPSRFQPLDAGYTWLSGAVWCRDGNNLIDPGQVVISKSDGDVDRPN